MFGTNDHNFGLNTNKPDLDLVLQMNLRELERLAAFYHQRGQYAKARELWQAAQTIRQQIEQREMSAHEESKRRTPDS